jgi:hypothetical protein
VERGANVKAPLVSLHDESSGLDLLHGGQHARDDQWIEMLLAFPAHGLVRNVQTRWALLRVGNVLLPITINDNEYENSYVCSTYSGCVLYPQSEVKKIQNIFVQASILGLVKGMGPPLRAAKINSVVCVNNWLLSTNLYSEFDLNSVPALTHSLVSRFPKHAIAFRSLNRVSNGPLIDKLVLEGYLLAPSRQVYFFDGESGDFRSKQNNIWDQKLLNSTDFKIVEHDDIGAEDSDRIEEFLVSKSLRGNIYQRELTSRDLVKPLGLFLHRQRAVDQRRAYPSSFKPVDLVFHQGDQRGDDDGKARQLQTWNLITEAFTASGGHNA